MLRLQFVFALIVLAAAARASVLEDLENALEAQDQGNVDDFVARIMERMQKGNTVVFSSVILKEKELIRNSNHTLCYCSYVICSVLNKKQ